MHFSDSDLTCSERYKTCSDILDQDICIYSFKPHDTDKICVFSGNECKEQYKTCDLYNNKVFDKN